MLAALPGTVLEIIKRERDRSGRFTLWKFQHLRHHEHPSFEDFEDREMDNVLEQNEARLFMIDLLSRHFPDYPFVIQTSWLYFSTWYQATPDAATADGDEWLPQGSQKTSDKVCAFCRQQVWSDSYELVEFRGVRWVDCLNCGRKSVSQTKTICDRIGPERPFVVPDF